MPTMSHGDHRVGGPAGRPGDRCGPACRGTPAFRPREETE